MINKCFLDLDGVLVNFNLGVYKIWGVKEDPYKNPANKGRELYQVLGLTKGDFFKHLNYDFWINLEWTEDGKTILRIVEEKFKDNVCILSSPTNNDGCLEGKRHWIQKHIPKYNNKFLLGNPKYFCASPTSILVDDSEKKCQKFREYGGQALLVPRMWNNAPNTNVPVYIKQVLSTIV